MRRSLSEGNLQEIEGKEPKDQDKKAQLKDKDQSKDKEKEYVSPIEFNGVLYHYWRNWF